MPHSDQSPLLAIVLMIKNEAQSIAATLLPFLNQGLTHFLIFDTGSTDDTVELTHQLLQNAQATYHLIQEPFIDFSSSRNRALSLAEERFSHIPFLLMPDAEWHLNRLEALLQFCEQQCHTNTPLFMIKIIMNKTLSFYTTRLFRTSSKIRFAGVVHEAPNVLSQEKVPEITYFNYDPVSMGIEKSKKRWQRDLTLLLTEYVAHTSGNTPQNPRTVFYLAQTYECLEMYQEAYHYYSIRLKLDGWDEETFITLFRLGQIAERLSADDARFSWELAQQHYHHAFALRPHRIEPLVKIADHYWPENKPLCYLYARQACEMPYPQQDILFVEKHCYEFTRFEILSRSAWYVGAFQLGLEATLQALTIEPETVHLQNNLLLYQNVINNPNYS